MWRGFVSRRLFQEKKRAAVEIQAFCRMATARATCLVNLRRRRAALKIQAKYRAHTSQSKYSKFRKGMIRIQAQLRGKRVRSRLGDFREIANQREAQKAKDRIAREREQEERKRLEERLLAQEQEMEATRAAQAEKEEQMRKTLADEAERRAREKVEEAERKQAEERARLEHERAEAERKRKDAEESARNAAMRDQASAQEEASKKLQTKLQSLAAELESVKGERDKYKNDCVFQREQHEKAQTDNNAASIKHLEELQETRRENLDLRDQVRTLSEEATQHQEEVANRALSLDAQQTELYFLNSELERLKTEAAAKDARLSELEAVQATAETGAAEKLRALERQLEDARFEVEAADKAKLALQELCNTTADESRQRVAELESSARKLRNEIEDAVSTRDKVQIELEFTQKKCEEAQNQVRSQKEQVEILEIELEEVKAAAVQMQSRSSGERTRGSSSDAQGRGTASSPEEEGGGDAAFTRPTIANQKEFLKMVEKSKLSLVQENLQDQQGGGTPTLDVSQVNFVLSKHGADGCSPASSSTRSRQLGTADSTPTATSLDMTRLRKQLQEKTRQLAEHHAAFQDLNAEFNIKREENRRYLAEVQQLKSARAQLELQAQTMVPEDQLRSVKNKKTELEATNARMAFSLTNLEKQKAFCEEKIDSLESEIEARRKQNNELTNKLRLFELDAENREASKNATSSSSIAAAASAGEGASSSSSPGAGGGFASGASSSSGHQGATSSKRSTAQQMLAQHDQDIQRSKHLDDLEQENGRLKRSYEDMKDLNLQFRKQVENFLEDLRKKNEENRVLRMEAVRLSRERDEIHAELQTMQDTNDRLAGTNTYYIQKVADQRNELSRLRDSGSQLSGSQQPSPGEEGEL
ncbi:unnamed protein product [Amoebophrya sp. A25]|nr:unnamed protein product [Amoebophrya sp. A25]|eukprot:GSA25T00000269001.1